MGGRVSILSEACLLFVSVPKCGVPIRICLCVFGICRMAHFVCLSGLYHQFCHCGLQFLSLEGTPQVSTRGVVHSDIVNEMNVYEVWASMAREVFLCPAQIGSRFFRSNTWRTNGVCVGGYASCFFVENQTGRQCQQEASSCR